MIGICSSATEHDRNRMRKLWQSAFPGDSDGDIDLFLSRFFRYAVVSRVDGLVVSMLFVLPTDIVYGDKRMPVGYIYAGATHPDYRNKGLYRDLIRFALSYAREQGMDALFLRPADDELAKSYRHMGFTVPMTCREYTVSQNKTAEYHYLDAASYRQKRKMLLDQTALPYVDWNETVFEHALGWCHAIETDGGVGLFADDGQTPLFWEWIGEEVSSVDGGSFTVRTVGTDKTIGLLYPLTREFFEAMSPVYMGYGLE